MPLATDDLLAFMLIRTWSIATGRRLRRDVPPAELTERELIDFWTDDHLWPAPTWDDPSARCQRQ
jgi:hypothetical protein